MGLLRTLTGVLTSLLLAAVSSVVADEGMADLHPYSPYEGVPLQGKMVTIQDGDRTVGAYLSKVGEPKSAVVVIQEWWGLNDQIRFIADRLAEAGYLAVAPDMYDGKVTSKPEEASKYMKEANADPDALVGKLGAAIRYVREAHKIERIATMGYCFGGALSLQAAIHFSSELKGAVIYYGFPEKDDEKLARVKIPLLGIFADRDTYITPDVVADFMGRSKKLGIDLTVFRYDAVHAFANPSNANYDKAMARDAWNKTDLFLKQVLE